MTFFISEAFANPASAAATAGQSDSPFSMIMIFAIFVLFYIMLIRPQSKRAKQHKNLLANLKKGDEIITSGGILGKVVNLDEQYIKLSISQSAEIILQKNSVATVLPKGTIESI